MFAAIRRYHTDPDSLDEVVRQVNEGFVPLISDMPGFVVYIALNAGQGEYGTVSVFEDQDRAEEQQGSRGVGKGEPWRSSSEPGLRGWRGRRVQSEADRIGRTIDAAFPCAAAQRRGQEAANWSAGVTRTSMNKGPGSLEGWPFPCSAFMPAE